jgi:hypothetical protein
MRYKKMDKDIIIKKSDKWFDLGEETVVEKDFNMQTRQEYKISYITLFKRTVGIMKFKQVGA